MQNYYNHLPYHNKYENIYQNKALQPGAVDGEGGGGIFVREKSNVSGVKTTFTNCIVHDNIAKANIK